MEFAVIGGQPTGITIPQLDSTWNGELSIKGTISQLNTPIPCRVRLLEKQSGRLIADIKTDSTGNYEFSNVINTIFFIVAHHPASQFNAVIQDNVVPK